MRRRIVAVLALAAAPFLYSFTASDYDVARQKIALIEHDQLHAGSRVTLTSAELNAWVEREVIATVPQGVRQPRLVLGDEAATGSALVDFGKLRRAQGKPPGWLLSQILDGERPVRVSAHIRSANGQARVDVDSVEISGFTIEGQVLDYLVHNYLMPMYPDAKIGQPFQLGHRIDRLDIHPAAVGVLIGK